MYLLSLYQESALDAHNCSCSKEDTFSASWNILDAVLWAEPWRLILDWILAFGQTVNEDQVVPGVTESKVGRVQGAFGRWEAAEWLVGEEGSFMWWNGTQPKGGEQWRQRLPLVVSGTSVKWGQAVLTFPPRQAGVPNHQWLGSGVLHSVGQDIRPTSHSVLLNFCSIERVSQCSIARGVLVASLCCQQLGLNFFQCLLLEAPLMIN